MWLTEGGKEYRSVWTYEGRDVVTMAESESDALAFCLKVESAVRSAGLAGAGATYRIERWDGTGWTRG